MEKAEIKTELVFSGKNFIIGNYRWRAVHRSRQFSMDGRSDL